MYRCIVFSFVPWYRQLQKLELSPKYQNLKSKIGIRICHTFGLLFWSRMKLLIASLKILCNGKFSDYLLDNYIDIDCMHPTTLRVAMSCSLQQTNNVCELFHSRFNQSFYKESLSIIKWLTVLIAQFQTDVYIQFKIKKI